MKKKKNKKKTMRDAHAVAVRDILAWTERTRPALARVARDWDDVARSAVSAFGDGGNATWHAPLTSAVADAAPVTHALEALARNHSTALASGVVSHDAHPDDLLHAAVSAAFASLRVAHEAPAALAAAAVETGTVALPYPADGRCARTCLRLARIHLAVADEAARAAHTLAVASKQRDLPSLARIDAWCQKLRDNLALRAVAGAPGANAASFPADWERR